VAWEIDTAHIFWLRSLVYLGELAELVRRLPGLESEARGRGDLYASVFLGADIAYLAHLAADRPDEADRAWSEAIVKWPHRHYDLTRNWALHARVETALYRGDGAAAWRAVQQEWPDLEGSQLLRVQLVRIISLDFRARSAIAAAFQAGHDEKKGLLSAAHADAARIAKEGTPWGDALADHLRAAILFERGGEGDALALLKHAERQYRAVDMRLHAAAASRRIGQLSSEASRLAEADEFMRAQGVLRPERMAFLLSPWREPGAVPKGSFAARTWLPCVVLRASRIISRSRVVTAAVSDVAGIVPDSSAVCSVGGR
jgi:hypothetical protein